ncbi:MAG TPA: VOC family protein [Acidobacteriaceae bacterium]|nr:VOC family protein [Acidobacteriaceae bacterium]
MSMAWTGRSVLAAAVLAFACPCFPAQTAGASQANPSSANPDLAGIAHVAIRVSDLDRSRAFFHKLGFEEAFAMNHGGTPTEAFFKINDRQFIELYPRKGSSDWTGFMHICFEAADLQAVHQDYVAHGLTPKPVIRAGAGNLLFTLQGPDEPGPPSDLRPAATENIEYTQYMPGSRHTLDRGKHLGPDRIADRMAGVGIPMADVAAATTFYEEKLSFRPATHPLEPGRSALSLPGATQERVEFLDAAAAAPTQLHFRIFFSVPDLRGTLARLRTLGFAPSRHGSTLTIVDPDGDSIVFIRTRSLKQSVLNVPVRAGDHSASGAAP